MSRHWWISTLILLVAAAFRLNAVTYGLSNVCLTVPEEYWLYDKAQTVSLYGWNITPSGAWRNLPGRVEEPAPLVTSETSPIERLVVRLLGCAAGLLTVALDIGLGRKLKTGWWWLAGLLMAAAPWFVASDRWTVRFDFAPLVIAIGAVALWESGRSKPGWRPRIAASIYVVASLSLLLIAPPLWWLAVIMLMLQRRLVWRWTLFVLLAGIVLIPGLQTPELWLASAQLWDSSTTAACILVGIILAVWWWRSSLPRFQYGILALVVVFLAGTTLYQDFQLKEPSASEWELIHWLQGRIPDDAVVQFDFTTWTLAPMVACPMGANVHYQPQSLAVRFFETRDLKNPYYYVSSDPQSVAKMPNVRQIADRYWVGRGVDVPNPVDVDFGDLAHLLGYQVLTPSAKPSDTIDVRIDYQFGANITPDALAYSGYIHVTPKDDPAKNWINWTDPFFAESGNTGSRRVMLNQHIRFTLPSNMPTGMYDVRFGIFNVYSGARLGDEIGLGEITVQ